MILNAVVFGLGNHEAAWRMPESDAFGSTKLSHWLELARIAEAAGFDTLFLGDVLSLLPGAEKHLSDTMDPLITLSALAALTERIGLIGTLSTSFEPPFHIARRFASLDHISGGRAGWNIVTSSFATEAKNFGTEALPDHRDRYAMAADVVDATLALWQSWDADARLGDKESGQYFDPAKVRAADHEGPFVKTAGPLNVPRSPQGRPLLVQAGSSDDGRNLAARYADVIFTAQASMEDAVAFRQDIRERAVAHGRNADDVRVLPGIMPVVGATPKDAQARLDAINGQLVHHHAVALLSEFLQTDIEQFDLDAPLPAEIGDETRSEANKSRFALLMRIARRENLTVRQLLQRVGGGRGHYLQAGTPEEIADTMEAWFRAGAADGFSVMSPVLPADLRVFAQTVVPVLRARGLIAEVPASGPLRERLV